jgi:CRP-like cAMP-binding protein
VREVFQAFGCVHQVMKGSFLLRQHEKNQQLFFIERGLVKAFYETIDGKEFIKSFIAEGGFIASIQAVVTGSANAFSVLALEDCVVLEVPASVFTGPLADDPVVMQKLNQALLQLAMKKEQREYEFLCLSPEQRYLTFCEREQGLMARLTQQDIAKYLGITPVALSRIRKRCGLAASRQN